ncbi:putative lipase domain protein [Trypanosoma grayi]|uniref:putative lipase domain protein n=1 Tax=Trypanosoma grayi TaxID=71804 RepID=UPI0004F49199|nr:putative lipase domain protein [Trypanosoma grayi]KEG11701.1 putative lipase domain protein [Trypanosoma grayi]
MGQATKQTRKKHIYGYDLYSEDVRQYSSLSDIRTVKSAVANNIRDYLCHTDAFEVTPNCDKNTILYYVLVSISSLIAITLFLGKDVLKLYDWITYTLLGICAICCPLAYLCDFGQDAESVAFLGTGSPLHGVELHNKDYIRVLKGRRLCVRVREVPNSSKLSIEAQLVGPARLFAAPCVYFSVSREAPYGRYFSKDGYFFPPALVEDVEILLKSLRTALLKKKQ